MRILSQNKSVLWKSEHSTLLGCVQAAVKAEADLSGADLSWADLSRADLFGADLSGADLSRADLSEADLSGADLSWADLSGAKLSGADLSGADLSGAKLSGADLSGADLSGAKLSGADLSGANLSWGSHDLLAEILRREAGQDMARRSFAGLVLVSRDWCWDQWLKLPDTPEKRWAAGVLAKWITDKDQGEHIDAIRKLATT